MLALKRRMTLFMEQGCAFYPYIYNALYSNPITQGYSYMPSGIHRASIAFRFSGVNLTVCARLGFTSSSPYHDALVRTESAVNALKSGAASQIRLGQIIEGPQFFKNTRDPLGPTDLVEVRGVFSASEDIAQQFNPARPEIIRPVNLSAPPVYPPFTFPQ
jgi:hypothetical protein